MGLRREARELALQFLYKYNSLKEVDFPKEVNADLEKFWQSFRPDFSGKGKEFTEKIVFTVFQNFSEIDPLISSSLKNWKFDRLSSIDKNILRIAVAEFLYFDDIDFNVSINEAIEIAKKYGAQNSGKFVNGVLDRIKEKIEEEKRRKEECLI
ncbi:MAG: transcription antitermination factor NusB [Candidatus Schekmanbacteria bacterium]|nr:MAG: transcription antitermination factor NusB [Candidatus Schekmanbacteria bacterium]